MIAPVKLPRLPANFPIVEVGMAPTLKFSRDWNVAMENIETTLNAILVIPVIQDALEQAQAAVVAAQAAADASGMVAAAATAAADAANMAAAAANAAAAAAAAQAAAAAREAALVNSYISPSSVLTTTPTTISVAAHTRYYGDGTSVPVSAGTVATTATGVVDYVSYVDPARTGGAVTYLASETAPTQGMDVHVVGAVSVPATGTATGGAGPRRPGEVEP